MCRHHSRHLSLCETSFPSASLFLLMALSLQATSWLTTNSTLTPPSLQLQQRCGLVSRSALPSHAHLFILDGHRTSTNCFLVPLDIGISMVPLLWSNHWNVLPEFFCLNPLHISLMPSAVGSFLITLVKIHSFFLCFSFLCVRFSNINVGTNLPNCWVKYRFWFSRSGVPLENLHF